jgi:hypothetical protein
MFYPNLVEAIDSYYKKLESDVTKQILSDSWQSTRQWFYTEKTGTENLCA